MVNPYNLFQKEKIQTRTVEFFGEISGIGKGDLIKVYIHKYSLKKGKGTGLFLGGDKTYEWSYIERDFEPKEKTSKIEKLTFDGDLTPKGDIYSLFETELNDSEFKSSS